MTSLLTAEALSVGYHESPVCAPVSLDVAEGQILAIVGANGTGKSTLLRTLLGYERPLAGHARVLGEEPDPRSAVQRAAVAAVLGEDAFFPALSVTEHLQLVAAGHGVREARAVVETLVTDVGLTDRADALPGQLSSGQRRRVLLASAFVRPRSLLVLDEPEQRLDAGMRRLIADWLEAEAAEGGGVVLATHDPALAAIAHEALVIEIDEVRTVDAAGAVAAIEAL